MYLPEGKVMPAYSTWQPTEGKIPPTASADQSATRRLVAPRGDPLRGNPIVTTLLGVFGDPTGRILDRGVFAVGSPGSDPAQPDASICPSGSASPSPRAGPSRPHSAVVGLPTRLWNRPNRPLKPNDSSSSNKKHRARWRS